MKIEDNMRTFTEFLGLLSYKRATSEL